MVGALDIAPLRRKVPVRTEDAAGNPALVNILVPGISAEGLTILMMRFPEIRKMLSGRSLSDEELTAEHLMKMAPNVVAAVIACGIGHPDDEAHEKWASQWDLSTQLDLIEAIIDLTFKDGFGPFVQKLNAIGLRAQMPSSPVSADGGKEAATKSPSQLNGASVSEVTPLM